MKYQHLEKSPIRSSEVFKPEKELPASPLSSTFNSSISSLISDPNSLVADSLHEDDVFTFDEHVFTESQHGAKKAAQGGDIPFSPPRRSSSFLAPRRSFSQRNVMRGQSSSSSFSDLGKIVYPQGTSRRLASRFPRRHSTTFSEEGSTASPASLPCGPTASECSTKVTLDSSRKDTLQNTPSLHATKAYSRRQEKYLRRQRRFSVSEMQIASMEPLHTTSSGLDQKTDEWILSEWQTSQTIAKTESKPSSMPQTTVDSEQAMVTPLSQGSNVSRQPRRRSNMTLDERLKRISGKGGLPPAPLSTKTNYSVSKPRRSRQKEVGSVSTGGSTSASGGSITTTPLSRCSSGRMSVHSNSNKSVAEWEIYSVLAEIHKKKARGGGITLSEMLENDTKKSKDR